MSDRARRIRVVIDDREVRCGLPDILLDGPCGKGKLNIVHNYED